MFAFNNHVALPLTRGGGGGGEGGGRKEGRKSLFGKVYINWWYLQYNNFSLGDHTKTAVGHFFNMATIQENLTLAFHGACNECSTNVDDLRISNTTLTCLAFQTCMTLCV